MEYHNENMIVRVYYNNDIMMFHLIEMIKNLLNHLYDLIFKKKKKIIVNNYKNNEYLMNLTNLMLVYQYLLMMINIVHLKYIDVVF